MSYCFGKFRSFYTQNGKNRYFKKRLDSKINVTHTLIKMGVLNIADNDLLQAYTLLIQDFKDQITYPLSEVIIKNGDDDEKDEKQDALLMNLFCEMDFGDEEVSKETQRKIAHIFADLIPKFKQNGKYFVYLSLKQDIKDPRKQFSNIHIQTNICVTDQDARNFYAYFLVQLDAEMPRTASQTPWEEILDIKVVQDCKINMRMNFCTKYKPCPECGVDSQNNMKDDLCSTPFCNRGYILSTDYYSVDYVINQDGKLDKPELAKVCDDLVYQLFATSIRPLKNITSADPTFIPPPDCPVLPSFKYKKNDTNNSEKEWGLSSKDLKLLDNTIVGRKYNAPWRKAEEIDKNSILFETCQQVIRYQPLWSRIRANKVERKIIKLKGGKFTFEYRIFVRGIGSNVCLNRTPLPQTGQKAHKSRNVIYFVITKEFLYQKCRAGDSCKNRISGCCNEFTSEEMIVPKKYHDILYNKSNNFYDSNDISLLSSSDTSLDEEVGKKLMNINSSSDNSKTMISTLLTTIVTDEDRKQMELEIKQQNRLKKKRKAAQDKKISSSLSSEVGIHKKSKPENIVI